MKKNYGNNSLSPCHLVTVSPCHFIWLIILTVSAACQANIFTPPRLATATAQGQMTPTATAAPVILAAPTATAVSGNQALPLAETGPNPTITVWINETSPQHERALQTMMAEFSQERQIDVELRLVSPAFLPQLVATAVLSDTLPDVILHPLEYTVGWAERGILDVAATDEIVDRIGRDTFDPAALDLVEMGGLPAAIPSDGYQQLLIYRRDWFSERGLLPPDNFDAMLTAAGSLFDSEALISGFVIPTESNLVTTHHAFEHIAAANGCDLIDDKGEVLILEPACREALDFYYAIVHNYSPSGVQTDTSTRNTYLSGRTGMIMASPGILPKLAGLDSSAPPTCPPCLGAPDYLAQNSGILTQLSGRSTLTRTVAPANFGNITYLGITNVADREAAAAFAEYWFNEGYTSWLAVETERKVPMRWGTAGQPRQFIDAWGTLPLAGSTLSLTDIYGESLVNQLRDGIANSNRWGFKQGQGTLMTTLYEKLTLSIVLQEMLSGYFTSSQTIIEAYLRVTELIPNYQYPVELEPAATPGS